MRATRVSFLADMLALVVHSTLAVRIPRQRSANVLASVMKADTNFEKLEKAADYMCSRLIESKHE